MPWTADRGQRLADFIELEGFDDRDDEFHGQAYSPGMRHAVCPRRSVNLASFRANGIKNLQTEAEKRLAM
ncbi:hypothetical protein ACVI8K_004654 [Bradyrhizobium barranii subsp. barranii]